MNDENITNNSEEELSDNIIYTAEIVSTIFLFLCLFTFKKFIVLWASTVVNLSSILSIFILLNLHCNLCMKCTKTIGMPCKMPFKLRYSIESLGGDVDRTIEDTFGYKIIYAKDGKLPEYMIFVGGLLYDKK